jgi:hypothetical protein
MLHLQLIIHLVGGDVPINSETLLVIDFVNLKNKPTQSFRTVHRDRIYIHIIIEVSIYTCINISICTKNQPI